MPTEQEIASAVALALRPKNTGAQWVKEEEKRAKRKPRIFPHPNHGYDLGRLSDFDTEITADETWLSASPAAEFPRLKEKTLCRFEVVPIGATRLAVGVLLRAKGSVFIRLLISPTQAVLESRAFVGKSIKIGQFPRRGAARKVLSGTVQTRTVVMNGARWIEIDRPLETVGTDLVVAINDGGFGR